MLVPEPLFCWDPEVDTETIPLTPAPPKEPVIITVWSEDLVSIVNCVRPRLALPLGPPTEFIVPEVPGIGSSIGTTSSSPSEAERPDPEDDDEEDESTTTLLL